MIEALVILLIALVVAGIFLFVMVATEGKVTITDNLTIHNERPYFRRPEYVHQFCADCGHQKAIRWQAIKYDTNTGKPRIYRWLVYCPRCNSNTFAEGDYGSVDEYEHVNREYGVIPDTSPDTDKPDDRVEDMPRPLHPPGTAKMNKALWDNYETTTTAIFSNWRGKRPDER